jgi:autotransporter translocation and assembly factor TamB
MKRILKWAGYLLLSVTILFLIGLLKWESLTYIIVQKAAQHYAGRAQIDLDISTIGGNPFSETTIGNITIRPEKGQPQQFLLTASTITCRYNLWDLKKNIDLFLQGLQCTASDPLLNYDLRVSEEQDQPEEGPTEINVPLVLPALDLLNGTVVLTDSEWNLELQGINSKLQTAAGTHDLQLDVESLQFVQQDQTRIDTGFTSLLRYTEEKLIVDSFEIGGQEILATGSLDLAQINNEKAGFAAEINFAENRLNITGSIEKHLIQASVRTEQFDIGELQKRLGGTGWDVSGNIRAEADVSADLEKPEDLKGSFVLDIENGLIRDVDIEAVSLTGNLDNEIFSLISAEARTPGNHILVRDMSVPLPLMLDGDPLGIFGGARAEFKVDITDIATILQLIKFEEEVLSVPAESGFLKISGRLKEGALHLDDARAVIAASRLIVDPATIPIPAKPEAFASLLMDLTARFESSDLHEMTRLFDDFPFKGQAAAYINVTGTIKKPHAAINLTGENLYVRDVEFGSLKVKGDVQLIQETPGILNSVQFTVAELIHTNATGTLILTTPAKGSWQQDQLSMNAVFQVDERSEVVFKLDGAINKETTGEITARKLDSDGLLRSFIDDRYFFRGADIKAYFKGLPDSPQVQLTGVIEEAGAKDVPFPLTGSFSIQYSNKGIKISEFSWKSYERNTFTLTGFLPYDPMAEKPFLKGDLSLVGHVDFPSLEDVAVFLEPWGIGKGRVDLDMDVTGSWDQPQGHLLLKAKGLQPPDTLRQYIDSAMDITCDIVSVDDSIFLKTASIDSALYTAQASGSWKHGFSLKELMQGQRKELRGQVTADADVQLKDLNFLRNKISGLRRLEGDLQGNVHVSGSINDPAVTGSFSLQDGEVSHTFNLPMLSAIYLQGELEGKSIIIKKMQLEVGGSPVELSGSISRDKEAAEVSLNLTGQNVLLYRTNDMRMRGDVDFAISGPFERLAVNGTIGLTGGYYTRNIDFLSKVGSSAPPTSEGGGFLFSFSEPPLKDAVFDIKITSIEPFRVRTNLVRGVLRPELSLRGTGELPFLIGVIYIDPTRVLLPSGRLRVQSGVLRFLAANPDRPELDLMAQSRVLDYDINVVTRGSLDDLVVTLSSSPPLPNEDLMLLLLTGQPPRDDAAAGTQGTASTNVMLYLGRDFLTRWLDDETGESDESIFDRFEMNFGRNVTKSGDQTVESSFRLSEEITGTGKKYYLTGEKDRYDHYNYGLRLVFRLE